MLILRRKVGEKIVIGDGIVVVVTRVSGARVTLGIEAPPSVHIVRGELRPFDDATPSSGHPDGEKPSLSAPSLPAPIELDHTMSPVATAAPHPPR